ncbi:MAG: hypothetical protein WCJ18_06805, partial [Planctomycetota bacterium]
GGVRVAALQVAGGGGQPGPGGFRTDPSDPDTDRDGWGDGAEAASATTIPAAAPPLEPDPLSLSSGFIARGSIVCHTVLRRRRCRTAGER